MMCPNCNEELNNNEKTCPKCGKEIIPIIDIITPGTKKEEVVEESDNTLPAIEGTVEPPKIEKEEELINPSLNVNTISNTYEVPSTPKKSNKKLFFIGGSILLIAGIIVAVVLLFPKKETEIVSFFKEGETPILIKKDGKYGYIDSTGKVIIEPTYDFASPFKGDYAITSSSETKYNIINKANKVVESSSSYYLIEYDKDNNVWIINSKLYNSDLKLLSPKDLRVNNYNDGYYVYYTKDGRNASVLNSEGEKVYSKDLVEDHAILVYASGEKSPYQEDKYCRVSLDNKTFAIVNCETGNIIQDFSTTHINVEGNNLFRIETPSNELIKYVYIKDDKVLWSTDDSNIIISHEEGDSFFTIKNKENSDYLGYLDFNTGEITTIKPHIVTKFETYTGYKVTEANNKYGIKSGETIIVPITYDKITTLDLDFYLELNKSNKKYILLTENNKTSLYNLYSEETEASFNNSDITITGSFLYEVDMLTKKTIVYNMKTNKHIELEENKSVSVYDTYVTVLDNGNFIYYNENLEEIYTGDSY